jgi:hypothetical protein
MPLHDSPLSNHHFALMQVQGSKEGKLVKSHPPDMESNSLTILASQHSPRILILSTAFVCNHSALSEMFCCLIPLSCLDYSHDKWIRNACTPSPDWGPVIVIIIIVVITIIVWIRQCMLQSMPQ